MLSRIAFPASKAKVAWPEMDLGILAGSGYSMFDLAQQAEIDFGSGVLHYAIKMKDFDAHSHSKGLAEGEVYASSIEIWCYLFRYRCRCRRINRFL